MGSGIAFFVIIVYGVFMTPKVAKADRTDTQLDSQRVYFFYEDNIGRPVLVSEYYDYDYDGSYFTDDNYDGYPYWQAIYSPFGQVFDDFNSTGITIGEIETTGIVWSVPFRFPGQYQDNTPYLQNKLYYNWNRWYSPEMGRYTQADQMTIAMIHPYSYASNNPLLYYDPFGLLDTSSPWQVGWEWLTGTGPRVRYFTDGDPFTEELKQSQNIQDLVKGICNGTLPEIGTYNYKLSGIEGVPKYFRDYSTLATGGLTGNLATTYLGSYDLRYSKTDENLNITVTNYSTIASATHPPVAGYTDWWEKNIGGPLNSYFPSGPMSTTTQIFDFQIKLDDRTCCKH